MKSRQTSVVGLLAMLGAACGLGVSWRQAGAGPVAINATLDYSETRGDRDNDNAFRQTFQVSLADDIAVTDTVSLTPGFRLNNDSSGERSGAYAIDPNLGLAMNTDLFSMNGSYSTTTRKSSGDQPKTFSQAWDVTWASRWDQPWPSFPVPVPSVRVAYGGNTTESGDDLTGRSSFVTGTVTEEYDISIFQLAYRFSRNMNWDEIDEITGTNDTHDFSVDASDRYLDDRVQLSMSHQTTLDRRVTEFKGGAGKVIEEGFTLSEDAFAGQDPRPAEENIFMDLSLANGLVNRTLTDRVVNIRAGVDTPGAISGEEFWNILVEVPAALQEVSRISLWLAEELALEPEGLDTEGDYSFDVYGGMTQNGPFHRLTGADGLGVYQSGVFPSAGGLPLGGGLRPRFLIDLPAGAWNGENFLKVVCRIEKPVSVAAWISEVTLSHVRTLTTDDEKDVNISNTYKTGLTMNVVPAMDWRFSTGLVHTLRESSPGGERTDLTHNMNLYWTPNRYFRPVTAFNRSISSGDEEDTLENRSYSMRVASMPLDALSTSLGFTRTEGYTNQALETIGDALFLSLDSQILPDLSASLAASSTKTTNRVSGATASAMQVDLTGNMRVTPRLTADATLEFSEADEEPFGYGAALSWRPTDVLACTLDYEGGNESTITLSPAVRLSRELQLTGSFVHSDEDDLLSVQSKWLLNELMTLDLRYRWREEEWAWNVRLTAGL
ncbi:MAG: hypothetical protein AB1634_02015 [Thermodesulfobacteriota bacterium]